MAIKPLSPLPKPQLIGKILSSALEFWLRSQLEQIEELHISINATNKQILQGYIPEVSPIARHPIYQGLHITEAQLNAQNIRFNFGRILKGHPLTLSETIPVNGWISITQEHIQASRQSSLMSNALNDWFQQILLEEASTQNNNIPWSQWKTTWEDITFAPSQLILKGSLLQPSQKSIPLKIFTGINVFGNGEICFKPLDINLDVNAPNLQITTQELKLDLGADVELEQINLTAHELFLKGKALVKPI